MPQKRPPDFILILCILLLLLMGILVLATASAPFSFKITKNPNYYLIHQIIYGLIPGLILGFIFFKLHLNFLTKISLGIFLISLFAMFLVFFPYLGRESGGAVRWIELGPIAFQPSEFLKIATILYLATWLGSLKKRTFFPFLVIIALISIALILQSDISTLIIITLICFILYFCARTPLWHTILIGGVSIISLPILIKIAPYRIDRLLVFLHSEIEPLGIGYHSKQALISVGSGQIAGSGLGLSIQKFGFLPQSISDSIFAIFAEETGFIGCAFLIILFLILVQRAFSISKNLKDLSLKLIVIGIGVWISFQSFINIGAMIGVLPLSGTPLPFISYGGSHLIAELIAMGVLLNISSNG
ncbi:MAG: hypothetical protein CO144_01405 [Candidatus Nealsonbacteria bacterium CG_4_9_14_3_um_filter_35_11]|uniref:Probable peptidoglycan glycosyltransferase FtsW n=2 Tax=Candidatus Nealsoniibacteriota TaxID=1817911 RepID=A0A2M7DBJ9_9BACT|nr:MAG: hypothetical protein COV62_00945 [Candidatus Nealsonbacteria bacterium CG11_big_fil_rev_8_21_14_0_20_35_11]PIV45787.1 MAG: hypothetical protein COS24_00405 [Candidatus Nealsonbacteria bacterium CG02_land_8_20_14_3_00_34_20]PIW92515.1 MAG: hypothetical protein COZ88_01875 [Candidatus Nealsonbacteria bacterium CG_4_8_14_3_um_filter_34_13]PIZ90023.1 MAG: hypothetical protein COX88_00575 [Candidatus Nealsonbacteria bacterium CG_4_10_14_0_2_um_filter_35_20]PJA84514.1 MAG: hypothetical protei